jgi:ParB-like chromosome segregation protein Spo0J
MEIPLKSYSNPLLVALKYKQLLDTPSIGSQTKLAHKVGVSRARISQFLRPLKLPPDIQQSVIQMGDKLTTRKITERRLRKLLVPAPAK